MIYKCVVFLSISIFSVTRPFVSLSGLLSSAELSKNVTTGTTTVKPRVDVSGQLSPADLSKVIKNKITHKKVVNLSGLLSVNQLNSIIQFIHTKTQQVKNISGLISTKDLDKSIVWKNKQKKPRVNLSGLIVQNYLDPDYQAAFKILNNTELQKEYENNLRNIETYFKEYYLSQPSTTSKEDVVIDLPKICCPADNQNYSLCSIP